MVRRWQAVGWSLVFMVVLVVAGCGAAPRDMTSPAALRLARLAKPGKLAQGPVLFKGNAEGGVALATRRATELTVISDAVRAALAGRGTDFETTTATMLDNATLAAQNQNPRYGELLATWGRQTGAMIAVESPSAADPSLMRVSVVLSRYAAPAGAQAAYRYVVEQYDASSRRLSMPPASGRAPWDDASLYYQEGQAGGQTYGQLTFIFRAGPIIAFVTNVGVAGQVSLDDTAHVAQAVIDRLREL